MMQAAQEEADGGMTPLEERLARDEFEARIDGLRKEIEADQARDTLHILLKYQSDITKAAKELATT